ncbi:MAG: hypothetical protein P4L56_26380 [Candidatus Sulfopaludibacter sp.]|nr:hypothetical protein [Candidatus Sulfopaludibacter sp.]
MAWKPLVVCPQPDFHRRLLAALAEAGVEQPTMLAEYPSSGTAGALLEGSASNICFLDAATDAEHAQQLISEFAASVPVVALHPRNDAELILRCLRRGACEFVADPTVEVVRGVLERLGRGRADSSRRPPGEIYCVVPGKPGCGASTVAAHLAIQFQRSGSGPVLLVDGDHLTASIAFILKLKPEFHLGDVVRDWSRMDDDLWSRLTVPAFGVDVLAAPDDPTTRSEMNRRFAGELCAFWRERYETVVLDLPDMRAAADCGFAALADTILLVTTNELAALQATNRSLRYLGAGGDERVKLRLILNRYTPVSGLKREDVKTALSLEPFASLCNEYDVIQTALLDGKPVPPGSRFGASVQALCGQLRQMKAPGKKSASWLTSLLHRKQTVNR